MKPSTKKALRRTGKCLLCLLLVLVLLAVGYVSYVLIAYYRIGDKATEVANGEGGAIATGTAYSFLSWNVGFAAYSEDFSFFMDGGTESRAYSKEEVFKNLDGILARLMAENPDFLFLQEVDTDSTRSYHVN